MAAEASIAISWGTLLARTHRNCSACAGCPHTAAASATNSRVPAVSGTVWALAATSLLTDVSSEMIASVLPVYLVLHLGLSPLAFGVIDGLYQGLAAVVRLAAGMLADRWRRHKEVAALGYGLSAACRLLVPAAGSAWPVIAGILALDRVGKGIRTAPRDALIAQRSPCRELSTAFGVHRAFDAAGAMLGPIAAFVLLALLPGAFDVLFAASFGFALMGLMAITLLVPGRLPNDRLAPAARVTLASAVRLFGQGRFRVFAIAGTAVGFVTISDSFIFLALQRRLEMPVTAFPLLYVGTSLFMSLFSIPFGRAADRIGRTRVLLAGYALLGGVYAVLLTPGNALVIAAAAVGLLGAYYAATDGVLTAMAAAELPRSHAGTGLALLATVTNLARLTASVLFGWLWVQRGVDAAIAMYSGGLLAAIASAAFVLSRTPAGESAPSGRRLA